jgi:hypothetical protein
MQCHFHSNNQTFGLAGVAHVASARNACDIDVAVSRQGGVILFVALASSSLASSALGKNDNAPCSIIVIFAAEVILLLRRIHVVFLSVQFLFLTMVT